MPYYVEVQLPADFARFNSVQPAPMLGADGYWYLVVYGNYRGKPPEQHLFRWKPGVAAQHVTLTDETDARGSIGVHSEGAALFSWQGSGAAARLICQEIPDFKPAPLDSRVDALVARVTALEEKLEAAGGRLAPSDRAALDRLKAFLGTASG